MDNLGFLNSFLTVLDEGSLSAGARRLGVSQPAVSQQIASLEQRLGKQLLHRSVKGSKPTRAGELLYCYAKKIQESHRQLLTELEALDDTATGKLRVSTSLVFAETLLGPLVQSFRRDHPDLDITLRADDRYVDVVSEGFDLAIRTGGPGNTDGMARKIGVLETALVASPAYLDQRGRPATPADLDRLEFIQYREDRVNGWLPVFQNHTETQAPVRVGFTVDTPQLLQNALNNNLGFVRGPLFMLSDGLKTGRLQRVLPDYTPEPKPIYAVYPHRHALNRRALLLIAAVRQALAGLDGVRLLPFPGLDDRSS